MEHLRRYDGRRLFWPDNVLRRLIFYPPSVMPTGCVDHASSLTPKGYHVINRAPNVQVGLHVAVWEWFNGPVPEGKVLDHLCRHRWCLHPGHLEPVPPGENTLRGVGPTALNARKTQCSGGHPFTPETTGVNATSGSRYCLVCQREYDRQRYLRRKATEGRYWLKNPEPPA